MSIFTSPVLTCTRHTPGSIPPWRHSWSRRDKVAVRSCLIEWLSASCWIWGKMFTGMDLFGLQEGKRIWTLCPTARRGCHQGFSVIHQVDTAGSLAKTAYYFKATLDLRNIIWAVSSSEQNDISGSWTRRAKRGGKGVEKLCSRSLLWIATMLTSVIWPCCLNALLKQWE